METLGGSSGLGLIQKLENVLGGLLRLDHVEVVGAIELDHVEGGLRRRLHVANEVDRALVAALAIRRWPRIHVQCRALYVVVKRVGGRVKVQIVVGRLHLENEFVNVTYGDK